MGRNQEFIRTALDIFLEYSMIISDEYGYKIKNWNKYQNLQEKGSKLFKENTKDEEKVRLGKEREKELEIKKEKEIDSGGERYTEQYNRRIKDFI